MSGRGAHHNVVGALFGSRKIYTCSEFEPLTINGSRIIIRVQNEKNEEDHYVPTIR